MVNMLRMVKTRRQLVKQMALACLVPTKLHAFPITRLLGDPGAAFSKAYIQRFLKWYEKTWSPLRSQMHPLERTLFDTWMLEFEKFGQDIGKDFFAENFLVRHCLAGQNKWHSSYYAGSPAWSPSLNQSFEKFSTTFMPTQTRHYLAKMHIFGWSHDFDQQGYKVFLKSLHSGQLFANSPSAPLGFIEFAKGEERRRGTIRIEPNPPRQAHRNIDAPTILSCFRIDDSLNKVYWKLRTRSTYLLPLKTGTMTVARSHKMEFHQIPDLIDVSRPDEIKVYYP